MFLSNPVSATHLSSILRMPSLWKSIPPLLLCSFPPALWTDQGEGITLSHPRSKQLTYQLTPPCHPGRRGRKTGRVAPARMCFWAVSANCGNFFPHLKPELFTRALGECMRCTGGWEEWRRESCCFSTSASNQSPEITAMVYGLWS